MFSFLKNMFGSKTDFQHLVKEGAIILDVRTPQEYKSGHIASSKNIPLDRIESQLHQFKDKNQTIITCCASGMRSGAAKRLLKSKGYVEVHNGGGWRSLQNKL